jgi:hypothetical protein
MEKYKTVDVSKPVHGRVVYTNTYWACIDGDPKQAVFNRNTAQCNKIKAIAERLALAAETETGIIVKTVFLPLSYCPKPKY